MDKFLMTDLYKKSNTDLKKIEEESRAELFALRFQAALGNLEKTHRIGELKKQIARILTVLNLRKNQGEEINIQLSQKTIQKDMQDKIEKIEEEGRQFAKKRQAKIEETMQNEKNTNDLENLDLSQVLNEEEINQTDTNELKNAIKIDNAKSKPVKNKSEQKEK